MGGTRVIHSLGDDMDGKIRVENTHATCNIYVEEPVKETIPPGESRVYKAHRGIVCREECAVNETITVDPCSMKSGIIRLRSDGYFQHALDPGTFVCWWIWLLVLLGGIMAVGLLLLFVFTFRSDRKTIKIA